MTKRHGRLGVLALISMVSTIGLVACTETITPPTPTPPVLSVAAPTPTPTPTTSTVPPPPPPVNPLTGVAPVPTGSVVAVKIDDTSNGRPQKGVDQADIVYIELAEGGLSRLVAVFATNKPVVEAVRSVRASDAELLSQYGAITLVASGGGGDALPTLYSSILYPVIDDRGDKGFLRDNSRGMPYNLTANLATITTNEPKGNPAQDIGFTWSADVPVGGAPGANIATKVGSTAVNFTWDPATSKYVRVINGAKQKAASGNPIATPNVIVQSVTVSSNPQDVDVNGVASQFTHTIGSGKVSVFRNGQRIDGTWSRSALTTGTHLTSAAGTPIALAPGGAWVVLIVNGATITSS